MTTFADFYAAPAPAIDYVAPSPAVSSTATNPVIESVASAPAVTDKTHVPVSEFVTSAVGASPAPVTDYACSARKVHERT